MHTGKNRQAWHSWIFVGLLAALAACLGVMQYRWIGEVSRAERERLRGSLQASLARLSQDFNWDLSSACAALLPDITTTAMNEPGREREYAARLVAAQSGRHARMLKTVYLATPGNGSLTLRRFNPEQARFDIVEWPSAWTSVRARFEARLAGDFTRFGRSVGGTDAFPDLIELPRFTSPGRGGQFPHESEWLLVEADLDYIRTVALPELFQRDLGAGVTEGYQAEIVMAEDPGKAIYTPTGDGHESIRKNADASVRLFDIRPEVFIRRQEPGRSRETIQSGAPSRGRWLLSVRHRSGSLEAVVQKARWRNLVVTTGLLLLLMAAVAALVRFTRRAQRLAELQMEFVAGVSHELRTPLSVMRTAGHNLRGRVAQDPSRVQRYGELIEHESEKLTAIVEQVLRFANANAGRVIGSTGPLSIDSVIEDAVQTERKLIEQSGCVLDVNVSPGLPAVSGDATALKHVLQNLLNNAVKYGSAGKWIGISASAAGHGEAMEIRVSDRGPGIDRSEVRNVFDPFYRGSKPTLDQIHGTGLGLSLAKRIVEAHGGTISVTSRPGELTEFTVRIPAAQVVQHELENLTHRG